MKRMIAVADIGSNSARMVVMQRAGQFGLIPLAESKVALRLERSLVGAPEGSARDVTAQIVRVVRDFCAVARSSGAEELIAVATSAVRTSEWASHIVEQVRADTGVGLRVLSGEEEAAYTFNGVISVIPASSGAIIDIGGGSMELVLYDDRLAVGTHTFPLGALKVSDAFALSGSGNGAAVAAVYDHVVSVLAGAGIGKLPAGWTIIGTGGTVRNAGKIERRRTGRYGRLHGQRMSLQEIRDLANRLALLNSDLLRKVSGLNPERSDSIVGGLAVLGATIAYLGGDGLTVSGAGLREGIALEAFGVHETGAYRSSADSVRDMCSRFAAWDGGRADRRARLALQIASAQEESLGQEVSEALALAALTVDAGSTIDYYQRYENAAMLIENSNAGALTHREIALVAAIARAADKIRPKGASYGGLISTVELSVLNRAGCLLRLADEVCHRLGDVPVTEVTLSRDAAGKSGWRVTFPGCDDWSAPSLQDHFMSVFREPLAIGFRR